MTRLGAITQINRRELLAAMLAAPSMPAGAAPTAPVAIGKCAGYDQDQAVLLDGLFDKIGGLGRLVKNKSVTVKVNLTGSPALKFQGKALGLTHYTHPAQMMAFAHLCERAGARRVRFVESAWGTAGPLEEYMLDSGWNVRKMKAAAANVTFDNTNGLGDFKKYVKFRAPGGGAVFPSYMLNEVYAQTDVFVSLAKLKNHATCGVTLSMKNLFGITPASIYGDDAGADDPNEKPQKGRVEVCHIGKRKPAAIAEPERDPASTREATERMPRIVVELNGARPVDLAIIDGIETVTGGEGPWIRGLRHVKPGIVIVGTNAVTTDTVATAAMGYDPRAERSGAFAKCANTLLLGERAGLGAADLKQIEVRGVALREAMFPFAG
ncbi:MAG: DUF362 domain-containing protein [Bryobacteraceae bacterium]